MAKKQITLKGDTVEYAIRKGLKRIGLPQDRTYVRVLQKDSHGFFTGHKEAIVAIVYDEEESVKALDERAHEEFKRNFKFQFKEMGAQVCLPAMFYDSRFYKDDEKRESFLYEFLETKGITNPDKNAIKQLATNPQAKDTFVTVKKFPAEPLNDKGDMINLVIAENKMEATAIIFHEQEVSEEELYEYFKENKIFKGVLRKNIQAVLKHRFTGFFQVAKGKFPDDDKPAPLEIYFQEDEHKEFNAMMETLTVDTRSVKDINIADRNQLLMKIGEVTIGSDGYNIEGTVLRKKEIAPTSAISCGKNVYMSDDETEVYAGKAGHIVWKADEHFIDIEPVYIVEGNVDFNEGNIIGFVGKVIVKGDVKPKFSVVAEGDIEIQGSVEDAIVESTTGNVFVGGSIIHQNEGYIQAKANVQGNIATNAKIRAENIMMQKEVMNSDLEAQNEIMIMGSPGVLVGGVAKARNLVRANILGSESWVPTKIHVGDVSEKKKRLRGLNQQIGKQLSELKEAKQIAKILQERQQTHDLSEAQVEQLNFAMDNIARLEEDIEYDREEEEEIKKEIESQREARLEVIKTLHPHVDLYIFEGYYLPPSAETRTGFQCKEGLIVRYSLV